MEMDDQSYLRMRRKKLKLKLQDVADYLEVSKAAVSMYECYKFNFSKAKVQKYYEFIEIKGGI